MIEWLVNRFSGSPEGKFPDVFKALTGTSTLIFGQLVLLGIGWVIGLFLATGINNFTVDPGTIITTTFPLIPWYIFILVATDLWNTLLRDRKFDLGWLWPLVMTLLIMVALAARVRMIINPLKIVGRIDEDTALGITVAIFIAIVVLIILSLFMYSKKTSWRIVFIALLICLIFMTTMLDARLQVLAIKTHAQKNCGGEMEVVGPWLNEQSTSKDDGDTWRTGDISFVARIGNRYVLYYTNSDPTHPTYCQSNIIVTGSDEITLVERP